MKKLLFLITFLILSTTLFSQTDFRVIKIGTVEDALANDSVLWDANLRMALTKKITGFDPTWGDISISSGGWLFNGISLFDDSTTFSSYMTCSDTAYIPLMKSSRNGGYLMQIGDTDFALTDDNGAFGTDNYLYFTSSSFDFSHSNSLFFGIGGDPTFQFNLAGKYTRISTPRATASSHEIQIVDNEVGTITFSDGYLGCIVLNCDSGKALSGVTGAVGLGFPKTSPVVLDRDFITKIWRAEIYDSLMVVGDALLEGRLTVESQVFLESVPTTTSADTMLVLSNDSIIKAVTVSQEDIVGNLANTTTDLDTVNTETIGAADGSLDIMSGTIELSEGSVDINSATSITLQANSDDEMLITDDGVRIEEAFGYLPSGDLALGGGGTITVTNTIMRIVSSTAGAVTGIGIADGAFDGQIVTIQGTDDTKTVRLDNGTNLKNNGGTNHVMGKNDNVSYMWDSGDSNWLQCTELIDLN